MSRANYSSLTEAMGRRHEVLRARCEDTLTLLDIMKKAPEAIEEIFHEFGELATELQQKTAQAQELSIAFNELREADTVNRSDVGALRRRTAELEIKLAAAELSHQDSISETRSLLETVRNLEDTLQERNVEVGVQARELSTVRAQYATVMEEVAKVRARLKDTAATLAEAESERRTLRDRLLIESEERLKQARAQEELERQYIQAKKAHAEAAAAQERQRHRITSLEAELDKANADVVSMRDALQDARARLETEAASHESQIEAIRSRVRLTETLLAQARDEARRITDEQMRMADTSDRLASSQAALEEARRERERAMEQVNELEKSRDALIGRANELLARLKERQHVSEQASKQIDSLKEQVARVRVLHEEEVEKIGGQMRALSDALAKERSDRAYAEGALETARKDRMQLQRVIATLKDAAKHGRAASTVYIPLDADEDLLQTPTIGRPREAGGRA